MLTIGKRKLMNGTKHIQKHSNCEGERMTTNKMRKTILKILKSEGYDSFEDFERVCKLNQMKRKNKIHIPEEVEESMKKIDIPEIDDILIPEPLDFDFSFLDEGGNE
jgi:ribosomal protein S8